MQSNKETFYYIDAECGSFKTTALCRYIETTQSQRHLVMQSTMLLLEQTYSKLVTLLGADKVQLVSCAKPDPALKQLREAVADLNVVVILCTERTGLRLNDYTNLVVHVDDVHTVTNYVDFHAKDRTLSAIIKDYIEVQDFDENFYNLKLIDPKKADTVYDSLKRYLNHNMGYDETLAFKADVDKVNGSLGLLQSYDITKLKSAISVTFYCAYFKNTLLYSCFSPVVNFVQTTIPGIKMRSVKFEDLIDCHYFKDISCSTKWITDNLTEYSDILQYIDNNEQDFIYSVNNNLSKNVYEIQNGTKLPVRSQGLNHFRDKTTCAWVVSEKPASKEFAFYSTRFNNSITSQGLLKGKEYYDMYQFVCRTKLRDLESTDVVKVYVFDKNQALHLTNNGKVTAIDGSWNTSQKKNGRPSGRDIDDVTYQCYRALLVRLKTKGFTTGLKLRAEINKWLVKQEEKGNSLMYSVWLQQDIQKRCGV